MVELEGKGLKTRDILTDASIRNAMVVHAAFGGSTNLVLHIPAIAHAAGLRRPTVEDWIGINQRTPRLNPRDVTEGVRVHTVPAAQGPNLRERLVPSRIARI